MNNAEARGQNARRAMDEFLAPAFDALNDAYMSRMAEIAGAEPWATDKIAKLAIAVKVVKEARVQIEAIIADGDVARSQREHAEKIARIPEGKRRYMGLPA